MGFGVFMTIVSIILFIALMNEKSKTKHIKAFLEQLLYQNRITPQEHNSVINNIGVPQTPPLQQMQPGMPLRPMQPMQYAPPPVQPAAPQMPPVQPPVQQMPVQPVQPVQNTAAEAISQDTVAAQPETVQTTEQSAPAEAAVQAETIRPDTQTVPQEQTEAAEQTPAVQETQPAPEPAPAAQPAPAPVSQPAPAPQPVQQVQTPVQPAPAPQPAPMPQPMPWQNFGQQPRPQYNMPTNFPPRPQPAAIKQPRPLNTAAIMLFIGVAFVILSGVVLSTAQWHSMSDFQRVGLISLAAVFFFGVSAFARRKLKLISSGLAFYMLGGVFTGISFLSLGYFNLMGDWFSTSGDGAALLFSVFALIVTVFSAGASKLYKKTAFTHGALYGTAVSVALIALQISNTTDTWAFMLNCVSAILLFINYRGGKLPGEGNDKTFRTFTAVITGIFVMPALVPGLFSNILGEWTVMEQLTVLLWAVELIFYAIALDKKKLANAAAFVVLLLIAESAAALKIEDLRSAQGEIIEAEQIKCVIAAIGMVVAFTAFRLVKKLASPATDGAFSAGVFITAIACAYYSGYMAVVIFLMSFAISAVLAHGLGGVSEYEQKVFRILSVIPACITAGIAGNLLVDEVLAEHFDIGRFTSIADKYTTYKDPINTFVVAALFLLLAFLYRYSGRIGLKLRTVFSDFVFVVITALLALGCYPALGYKGGSTVYLVIAALLLALLTSTYVFERKPKERSVTYVMRRFYPAAVMYFVYSLSMLAEEIDYRCAASASADNRLIVRAAVYLVLGAAVMVTFLNIRKIRTPYSDFAIPAFIAIQCIELSDSTGEVPALIAAAAAWTALSVLLLYEGFDRESGKYLVVIRAFSPLMLFAAKDELHRIITARFEGDGRWATVIFTIVILAAAVIFTMLTRKARAGGELSRTECGFFAQHQYIWAVAAGAMLWTSAGDISREGNSYPSRIILLCLCTAVYLLCERFRNNLPAFMPLTITYGASTALLYGVEQHDDRMVWQYIIAVALFTVYCVFSRLFHKNGFIEKKPGERFSLDLPAILSVPAILMVLDSSGTAVSGKAVWFTALIMASIFCLNLIRSNTTEQQNKLFITLSSAFLCMLIWVQPFGEIENEFLLWKLDILPVIFFGLIHRYIWKNATKNISDVNFIIFVAAYAALMIDALAHQSLANTIAVLLTAMTIMLVSFALKNGRWFLVSSASFLALTLYITRDFLAAVQWWVYLLAAGILLIVIATVNEYLKTRGENLKDKMSHAKDRWK